MKSSLTLEIASIAARLIVEEGLEYGPAKQRALRQIQGSSRVRPELPDNELIEEEVRTYLQIFCADTQPAELLALRQQALVWMERLTEFSPHLTGAIWNGTATRLNDIWINLFCDDSKAVEIFMINQKIEYEAGVTKGFTGKDVNVISLSDFNAKLNEYIGVHITIYDYDELRGALKKNSKDQRERGSINALSEMIS